MDDKTKRMKHVASYKLKDNAKPKIHYFNDLYIYFKKIEHDLIVELIKGEKHASL